MSIMEQKADEQIEAGLHEREQLINRITELESQNRSLNMKALSEHSASLRLKELELYLSGLEVRKELLFGENTTLRNNIKLCDARARELMAQSEVKNNILKQQAEIIKALEEANNKICDREAHGVMVTIAREAKSLVAKLRGI